MNGTGAPDINRQGLDGATVRQYLLDELTPDARERLEERLMTEDELFAQLLTLEDEQEDELIDQYVHDQLSEAERERFERVFLSTPERREKLELVRDLKAHAASTASHARGKQKDKKKKGPGFISFLAFFQFQSALAGLSLVAALLLTIVVSAWLFSRVRGLESEMSQLRAEQRATPFPTPAPDQSLQEQLNQLKARNGELEAGLRQSDEERSKLNRELAALMSQEKEVKARAERVSQAQPQVPVLSLVLPLVRSRAPEPGQDKILDLTAGAARVQLLLDLDVIDPGDYKRYRAVIKRRDGAVVWQDKSPAVVKSGNQGQIAVSPPARLLSADEYLVELSGIPANGSRTTIGIYTFRVKKR